MIAALDQMSQPNPEQQQLALAAQQLQLQAAQADIAVKTTQAENNRAEAQKLLTEAQLMPQEVQAKVIASTTTNLPQGQESSEFDKRVKIAELMLKEADIKNKTKIVELQMADKLSVAAKTEEDFLTELTEGLKQNA